MNLAEHLRVHPHAPPLLTDDEADRTPGVNREQAEAELANDLARLNALQHRLFAESRRSVLIVLQGLDAAGKDGTIRHVFGPLNPQGVQVTGFGPPSTLELAHDYLWRVHAAAPRRGRIGIFNRSHYEDVLIVRVESLVPEGVWSRRYEHINAFERLLTDEGTTVLKFFLHVSEAEQLERLTDRVTDPTKGWKYNAYDWEKRKKRPQYLEACRQALARCSTDHAPWFLIPADKKWYRNFAIARLVADTLEAMDPAYPALQATPEEVIRHLEQA